MMGMGGGRQPGIQYSAVDRVCAAHPEVWEFFPFPSAVTLGKWVHQCEFRCLLRKAGQIILPVPRDPRKMYGEKEM